MKKIAAIIVFVLLLVSGYFIWQEKMDEKNTGSNGQNDIPRFTKRTAEANYLCNEGKTIKAAFFSGPGKEIVAGEPPLPSGSIKIILSDGRNLDLNQTLSADGSRYANNDESFVFWSKGNTALVLENNVEKSYIGCVAISSNPGGLEKVYQDGQLQFSIRYPYDFVINNSYKYQGLGPNKDISGVKFTIPSQIASGTNLSSFDTGVSVEAIPTVKDCRADLFLYASKGSRIISDNGQDFSFASSTEAAAGNIYEEFVWAIPKANPCLAVRYLIHYGNIKNYPEGVVKEFDRQALLAQFNKIRRSFTY